MMHIIIRAHLCFVRYYDEAHVVSNDWIIDRFDDCHRNFIKDERFLSFVKENPQVQFMTKVENGKHPCLRGYYCTYSQ